MNKKPSTIAIICFGNPQYCNALLDVIKYLSSFFRIVIVARDVGDFDLLYPKNVLIYKFGKHLERGKFEHRGFWKFFEYLLYIFRISFILRKESISVVYCYDLLGFVIGYIANRLFMRLPIIYHQNETILFPELSRNSFLYWVKILECFFTSRVDVLVFPEPNKARLFLEDARLNRDIFIVPPCPRKIVELPKIAPTMQELKLKGCFIVIYQGVIGEGTDIFSAVCSMKFWPSNAVFVILGWRTKTEEETIKKLALEEGVQERVIFVSYVATQEELYSYTIAADVGLVLYKPIGVNRQYVSPTKFYEYLACGVPIILPASLLYLSELVTGLGVGASYSDSTSEAIGRTVCELLKHPARETMSIKARNVHFSKLNFECQFTPVMEFIRKATMIKGSYR